MTEAHELIFALTLDGQGGATATPAESHTEGAATWQHLDYSLPGSRKRLQSEGLPLHVVNTLTRLESRPLTMPVGAGLMVILRGINRNAGADPEDMVSLRVWLEQGRIISVRQRPVKAAQTLHDDLEAGQGPRSAPGVLIELIQRLMDGVALFVDAKEAQMDRFEGQTETESPGRLRSEISELRRQVAAVRRYLAPERDALESLIRLGNSLFDEGQAYALREQADRITRYVEDLDLVREHALVTQEELTNRVAQEQNTRTYLLTIVAAIFLPLTFLSGVFGMNTAGLPGLENPMAFWWVSGAMVLTGVAVALWLRLKKWF
jgi:zinc transporter